MTQWTKQEKALFSFAVYQQFFFQPQKSLNWKALAKSAAITDYNKDSLSKGFDLLKNKQDEFTTELTSHLKNWHLTYPMAKCFLYTALTQLSIGQEEALSKSFSDYLHLSHEYLGSESVGLIHAVLLKIFEKRGLNPKKEKQASLDKK